ncbi:MAG: response regulator [Deltaproteobacteria bacterium]
MEEKRIKILNIEDEDIDHLALMRMVKEKGLLYEVERAANLAGALKLLGEKKYDVALIDYRLPNGTGLDILDKLKGTASIFVTGSGDERVAVKAMKGGANDYIIKDPNGAYLEMLPAVVDKAMEAVSLKKEKEEAERKLREKLDTEERLNKLLLKREFRIKELRDENDKLKERIGELQKKL